MYEDDIKVEMLSHISRQPHLLDLRELSLSFLNTSMRRR